MADTAESEHEQKDVRARAKRPDGKQPVSTAIAPTVHATAKLVAASNGEKLAEVLERWIGIGMSQEGRSVRDELLLEAERLRQEADQLSASAQALAQSP